MKTIKKLLLTLLTAVLAVMSSGAMAIADVPIDVGGGTIYNFNYVTGTYNALRSTYFNTTYMPWWGSQNNAIAFATAVGGSLGLPNSGGTHGPMFSYQDGGENTYMAIFSLGTVSSPGNAPIANSYSYAIITPASAAVPEIDGALIPQVGLLLAGLFFILGRRKERTEPMLAV